MPEEDRVGAWGRMFKGVKCRDTSGKKKQTDLPFPLVSKVVSPSLPPPCSVSAPCVDVSASLPALEGVVTGIDGGVGASAGFPPTDTHPRAPSCSSLGQRRLLRGTCVV